MRSIRILGIDPGLRTTGFGVIEQHGQALSYIASGTIDTEAVHHSSMASNLPARLKVLFDGVCEVVQTYKPHESAVEVVFVNANPKSTLLLGQARGACVTALVHLNVPVAEYTALQLKQAVVGYGKAHKSQVQEMVKRLLGLTRLPGADAADALGIAIAHAHAGSAHPSAHIH